MKEQTTRERDEYRYNMLKSKSLQGFPMTQSEVEFLQNKASFVKVSSNPYMGHSTISTAGPMRDREHSELAQRAMTPLELIIYQCDKVKELLVKKNQGYGNSVFESIGVFAKDSNPLDLINVRIDDKLSRIKNLKYKLDVIHQEEDTELDLIGYLILKRAVRIYLRNIPQDKPSSYYPYKQDNPITKSQSKDMCGDV